MTDHSDRCFQANRNTTILLKKSNGKSRKRKYVKSNYIHIIFKALLFA